MSKVALLAFSISLFCAFGALSSTEHQEQQLTSDRETVVKWARTPKIDHSKFEQLNKDFDYAPDVTSACLECHVYDAKEVQKSFHWNWGTTIHGQKVGKGQNGMNNYCISARGNEMCTSCHAGYGWRDDSFDFKAEENVDCLACHDTTGTYNKYPLSLGHPSYEDKMSGDVLFKKVDLKHVAQNVGKPDRENCLMCHANGGGGNGVKHGDTDLSLVNPEFALDVHMSPDKLNFSCQQCHTTKDHQISGRYYDKSAIIDHKRNGSLPNRAGNNVSCESCHGPTPHDNIRLNNHTAKVACATCHIPKFARGQYLTKLSWDWSTAGQLKDGAPFSEEAEFDGVMAHSYMSKKGTFVWGRNVVPSYRWYNGTAGVLTFNDTFDPKSAPIDINKPNGNYLDSNARIWPFKIHPGNQPYDIVNNNLLPPYLFGKKGSGAFWSDLDWVKALEVGAKLNNINYSGKFGFIKTNYYGVIKHMVAPSDQSLQCLDCHVRKIGRLEELKDFYLVGRDRSIIIQIVGIAMILFSIGGIAFYEINRRKK